MGISNNMVTSLLLVTVPDYYYCCCLGTCDRIDLSYCCITNGFSSPLTVFRAQRSETPKLQIPMRFLCWCVQFTSTRNIYTEYWDCIFIIKFDILLKFMSSLEKVVNVQHYFFYNLYFKSSFNAKFVTQILNFAKHRMISPR